MPPLDQRPEPLLFDAVRATQLLGVSVKTVRRETMIGRLPCARVGVGGRSIRYSHEHIAEYIRRCTDVGRPAAGIRSRWNAWA
jgi:DNA-binding transcriptional MerR regulator